MPGSWDGGQTPGSTTPGAPGLQEWPWRCRNRCSCRFDRRQGSVPAGNELDSHNASSYSSPRPVRPQNDGTLHLSISTKHIEENEDQTRLKCSVLKSPSVFLMSMKQMSGICSYRVTQWVSKHPRTNIHSLCNGPRSRLRFVRGTPVSVWALHWACKFQEHKRHKQGFPLKLNTVLPLLLEKLSPVTV